VLGFLTREFTLQRENGLDIVVAVYVPTNHLYLGDVLICSREQVMFPDITVEDGIRIFLTGGMAVPMQVLVRQALGSGLPNPEVTRGRGDAESPGPG
jgi:uncharacterized membrane protein